MAMTTRRPVFLLSLLTLVLAVSLAACGGDDDSGSASSSDADADTALSVGEALSDNAPFEMDDEDERCVGTSLIEALGEEEARTVAESDDASQLSGEQKDAATVALNECLEGATVAAGVLSSFAEEAGAEIDDPELESCIADQIDGRVGDVVVQSSDNSEEAFAALVGDCPTNALVSTLFKGQFVEQGFDEAAAQCVADQLAQQYDLAALLRLESDSSASAGAELENQTAAAVSACGITPGG